MHVQIQQWKHHKNVWNLFKVKTSGRRQWRRYAVPLSLLLTVNRFLTFFWYFYCSLWTSKSRLEIGSVWQCTKADIQSILCQCFLLCQSFPVPFLYPLKTSENFDFLTFSGVIEMVMKNIEIKGKFCTKGVWYTRTLDCWCLFVFY